MGRQTASDPILSLGIDLGLDPDPTVASPMRPNSRPDFDLRHEPGQRLHVNVIGPHRPLDDSPDHR
jgi:hypothetical protein